MHHMYPMAKGDPLCPLGFHPQVRWPTRCKRCFRDYKEHGGKRREEEHLRRSDATASSPSLSSWAFRDGNNKRTWTSSQNLSTDSKEKQSSSSREESGTVKPSSWISTPDLVNLEDDLQASIPTVSLTLPKRKIRPIDTGQRTVSDSVSTKVGKSIVFDRNDSLAERSKKLQAIKEATQDRSRRIHVKEIKTVSGEPTNHDVQFLIKVKAKPAEPPKIESRPESPESDTVSLAGTETTETTLVDRNEFELREKYDCIKKELEEVRAKCERLEKEKGNILLRRLTAMDTTSSKTSEVLKLQQRCNELQSTVEDYKDEKNTLQIRVKELEEEMENRLTVQAAQKIADELRSKLLAAETLCEELMDENEDMKKELRDLEDEMEEMQDNFREDQADEYSSLKKELEQTTKNCRILSFKLRKTERKVEELEKEKVEYEKTQKVSVGQSAPLYVERIKHLEQELATANETNSKLTKAPSSAATGKSDKGKVSRESLTRGGSQDDSAQLLRDLQDSLEREADLREQLKFAEEEAQNLRKKASRIEDDNESLVLQLKKVTTRAKSRKLSPSRFKLDSTIEKDEGIAEDEDSANLKLQLELSEQEASVLREKIEEYQTDNNRLKQKTIELQDKLISKSTITRSAAGLDKGDDNSKRYLALQEEINELRKQLVEKEKDCDRLNTEINLSRKQMVKNSKKNTSLDLDKKTLDLNRQLQLMEQETSVLRNKVQCLETENETLSTENKKLMLLRGAKTLKTDKSLDRYIDKIAELELELSEVQNKMKLSGDAEYKSAILKPEGMKLQKLQTERDKLLKSIEKMKKDCANAFKRNVPKAPGELVTKAALRNNVADLEKDMAEMMEIVKNSERFLNMFQEDLVEAEKLSKSQDIDPNSKQLEELNAKLNSMESELSEQKTIVQNERGKYGELEAAHGKASESLKKALKERDLLKTDVDRCKNEKKNAEVELAKLKLQLKATNDLKSELDKREKEMAAAKEAYEGKLKTVLKELDEERSKTRLENSNKIELSEKWETDRNSLNKKISEYGAKVDSLENTIRTKESFIKQLEETLRKERLASSAKTTTIKGNEIENLNVELTRVKTTLRATESKLDEAQREKKSAEDTLKKIEKEVKAEKLSLEKKSGELEIDLQNEKKKLELLRANIEKEQNNKEVELTTLKNKIKALELNSNMGNKKITEIKSEYQQRIDRLEVVLASEKKECEELTAKYEILEEEHVVTKAKLVMEKETMGNQLSVIKQEKEILENDLQKLRESLKTNQDTWIKEKLELQEKIKALDKKPKDEIGNRLKSILEEKQLELDQLKKEHDVMSHQMDYMRKENDELRKKLDDFDKVSKIQRNISADSTAMEKEIKLLKTKLNNAEKLKKSDVAQCKMRYESQISVISEELQSLQSQVMRFKRERDTYKHMLEGAQRTIGELKNSPSNKSGRESRASIASFDELEEWRSKVATLEQQISCMEDELSEARLEGSKLKTELVSERSSWDIKIAELHSRVNELEEEKILSSGRTKIAGLRTRMELAWHKEREEQQRLLQETATLARDLRQTLFEVERERDKERLESKRKQDQLKKTAEDDQEENKRKLTEIQCDLLELRDAHAKLRTTNEKLRREKERHEKEREEMKLVLSGRRRMEQEDDRRITSLIEQVENLMQMAPELLDVDRKEKEVQAPNTPTPPRRTKGPKSRESSPGLESSGKQPSLVRADRKTQVQSTMRRIIDVTEELKRYQRLTEDDRERERLKRVMGMRRATSTEHENALDGTHKSTRGFIRNDASGGNSMRKSLSLEHAIHADQNIWKGDDDSLSSRQSLEASSDVDTIRWAKQDVNSDSRLSGGSTQSESGEHRKKKGLLGKLKKLTKSRSIDDQDPGYFFTSTPISSQLSSSSDVNDDPKGSKKDLKERIAGIFKKSGSSSRSNSVERQKSEARHDTSSSQRPLMKNENSGSLSRQSPSSKLTYNSSSSAVSDSSRSKKPTKSK